MTAQQSHPWYVRLILRRPTRIMENVQRAQQSGLIAHAPNEWQLCLGVLRMWHRMLFRPETVGTASSAPMRSTLRAKIMLYRPLRLPFLLKERVIAPFDLTGMLSPPERIRRHMIGAYHAGNEFHYDLQLLSYQPGELENLRDEVRALLDQDTPRHRWLRDLCVYEGYHEALAEAVDAALEHGVHNPELDDDPDWSLVAYLNWCARQPQTRTETRALRRAGKFRIEDGLLPEATDA